MNRFGIAPTEKDTVFDAPERFEQVSRLRRNLKLPRIEPIQYAAFTEQFADAPTIGIEIEMTWTQVFPELAAQWQDSTIRPSQVDPSSDQFRQFSKAYDKLDRKLKPTLEIIEKVIPRVGRDAYWEFSFLPSKHIGVTLAEVHTLYDAGILREGVEYATHMTVATIDNDRDGYAFLCGLELSGGSTPERIKTAIESKKGSWARKGAGGLMARQPHELMGDDDKGYEFRTLVASSAQQIESLLLTAAQLASMYQNDPVAWKEYRTHIESFLKESGLELTAWLRPGFQSAPWLKYIDLMHKSKKDA